MPKAISRRVMLGAPASVLAAQPVSAERGAIQNVVSEFAFPSQKQYRDPFGDVDVDAVFRGPNGRTWRVPAFWAGGDVWRVRFAPPTPGAYRMVSECTDRDNTALHGQAGTFTAAPYQGDNPLLRHGAIRLSAAPRHFEHADGTPFFFLGDDWWHGLTTRLRWPEEFRGLALDRKKKGFTVIKITAGLNCDVAEFDERNHNEAGHCWREGYERIRPEYFDWADQRIAFLVEQGLTPAIVGAWGYYLTGMGVERMKRHWRYVVARWGAYPVIWQLTMESDMPYYLSKSPKEDAARQRSGWSEVGRYLRELDPWKRLITMQPSGITGLARKGLTEPALLDFDSMQCGHMDWSSVQRTVRMLREAKTVEPQMPVMPGEVTFEGIGWQNWQNIQRWVFWASLLNGAAGFCYGANGIWQFNRREQPFGPSPHGRTWGGDAWDVAAQYEGSRQVGLSKRFLERYPYWRMEARPDWIEWPQHDPLAPPYLAGIPGELRIAYLPNTFSRETKIKGLEPGVRYRALWFDPVLGVETPAGAVEPDAAGEWRIPALPGIYDFVLVLERA